MRLELAEHLFDAVWIVCVSHYSIQKLHLERAVTFHSNEYL